MSKEIKAFLDYLTSQTGFSAENMASEIEAALEQVVIKSKKYPEDALLKVQIDPSSGELEIFEFFTLLLTIIKTSTHTAKSQLTKQSGYNLKPT